jgi:hypothetical protein
MLDVEVSSSLSRYFMLHFTFFLVLVLVSCLISSRDHFFTFSLAHLFMLLKSTLLHVPTSSLTHLLTCTSVSVFQVSALWTTARIELESADDMRARPRAMEQMLQLTRLPTAPPPPSAGARIQNVWAVRLQPRCDWKHRMSPPQLSASQTTTTPTITTTTSTTTTTTTTTTPSRPPSFNHP